MSVMKINRIEKLQQQMKAAGVGQLLVEDEKNRQYLTYADIWEGSFLVKPEGAWLLVDFRYYEMAKRYTRDCEVVLCADIDETLGRLTDAGRDLAIEQSLMPVGRKQKLEARFPAWYIRSDLCADEMVKGLRRIKDAYELDCIRKAQQIADDAYAHVLEQVHPGMMESEIKIALGSYMIRHGSGDYNIGYITSSGYKTSMPHGGIGDKLVEKGDLIMIDFGARVEGYGSDCTRTFAVGSVTDEQREVYAIVRAAQEEALRAIRPGVTGQQVDRVARDFINRAGYEGCFEHGLGHSIGLDGHENPRFNQVCTDLMQPGIVMTVEPGIYLENRFGVRIEDMGVITEDGFEDFTHCTKDLIVL